MEEDKEKPMKKSQKLLGKGKGVKKVNQNNQKPGVIREEKEKGKKLVENKKKGTNTSQITSKNRSVVLLKPVEV